MVSLFVARCLRTPIAAAESVRTAAYSQFTHPELADLLWTDSIRPLFLRRYLGTTEVQSRRAHGYTYGGCLIYNIGHYSFGKDFFSDVAVLSKLRSCLN